MSGIARRVFLCGLVLVGCGVAVAGDAGRQVDHGGAEPERVLGKRAFDAAAVGHAPFRPLVGESLHGTAARAADHVAELERDLALMQRHHDATEAAELALAGTLLTHVRLALTAAEQVPGGDAKQLAEAMSLIDEAQLVLDGARNKRIRAAA